MHQTLQPGPGSLTALILAALLATLFAGGCHPEPPSQAEAPAPRTSVIWISIDGVRADYLERAELPFLGAMAAEGAFSRSLVPVFPSLTFPGHVSKSTGTTVDRHGVTGNLFIDARDGQLHDYPWDSSLLEAEPIWTTATRQGIRVAVHDWVLSHSQRGEHAAAYFGDRFNPLLRDAERLDQLLESWEHDPERRAPGSAPLQLLMGYMVGPDAAGHSYGPFADEPLRALERADRELAAFFERARALWERERGPADSLFLVVSTDHGMAESHTMVNLQNLVGLGASPALRLVASGTVGHVFLGDDDARRREAVSRAILERVNGHAFARGWRREELPERWAYAHPSRTGDLVVTLEPGYVFSRAPAGVTQTVEPGAGPLGMHGYDPEVHPDMHGVLLIARYPGPLGGIDLGLVHSLQLHATVAALLGIAPADMALGQPVALPQLEGSLRN